MILAITIRSHSSMRRSVVLSTVRTNNVMPYCQQIYSLFTISHVFLVHSSGKLVQATFLTSRISQRCDFILYDLSHMINKRCFENLFLRVVLLLITYDVLRSAVNTIAVSGRFIPLPQTFLEFQIYLNLKVLMTI